MIIRVEYLIGNNPGKKTFDSSKYFSQWAKQCENLKITSLRIYDT